MYLFGTVLRALLLCLELHLVSGIVGGKQAVPPQPDAAVVFVQKYDRNARVEGIKNDARGYYTFLGLRYAEPPEGDRRFQRASASRLEGEVRATQPCAPCAQPHPARPGDILGQEDCLCLNIFAPKMPGDAKGSPVLFWVHGGGFRHGSAAYYGGEHLAQKDTILVSVQYRLGSLGFLSNGAKDISGNAGLFDLSTALQWVLDYIEFFGGDPSRVVTFGQGSGGTAASLLALSPLSGRSVSGVAALSGPPLARNAVERAPEEHAQRFARHTSCPERPPEKFLACLRNLPVHQMIKADSKVQMDLVDAEGFLSEVSGNLGQYSSELTNNLEKIPDYIKKQIVAPLRGLVPDLLPVKELHNTIPVDVGKLLNLDTYYSFLDQGAVNLTQGLVKIVEATSDALFNFPAFLSVERWGAAAPAFLYSFEHQGNRTKGNHFLAGLPIVGNASEPTDSFIGHGDELAYLFEPLDLAGQPVVAPAAGRSAEDDRVRDLFTDLISRFAHNLTVYAESSKSSEAGKKNQYLQIGTDIKLLDNFRFCQMGLWGNIQSRLQDTACTLLAKLLPTNLSAAKDKITGVLEPISSAGLGYMVQEKPHVGSGVQGNSILMPLSPRKGLPKPGGLLLPNFGF